MLHECDIPVLFHYQSALTSDAASSFSGKTPDINAYQASWFRAMIDALPDGFFVVGDPAYPLSDQLITSFTGTSPDSNQGAKDDFNYFHSQVRITIERLFGQMVNKWGILWQPMRFKLKNIFLAVETVLRLHNFCINSDLKAGKAFKFRGLAKYGRPADIQYGEKLDGVDPNGERLADVRYQPYEEGDLAEEENASKKGKKSRPKRKVAAVQVGVSDLREEMRAEIEKLGAKRPKVSADRLLKKRQDEE